MLEIWPWWINNVLKISGSIQIHSLEARVDGNFPDIRLRILEAFLSLHQIAGFLIMEHLSTFPTHSPLVSQFQYILLQFHQNLTLLSLKSFTKFFVLCFFVFLVKMYSPPPSGWVEQLHRPKPNSWKVGRKGRLTKPNQWFSAFLI